MAGAQSNLPNADVVLVPHLGCDVFAYGYDCIRDARNSWLLPRRMPPDNAGCLETISSRLRVVAVIVLPRDQVCTPM
jgi:hypothetical protein